MGGLDDAAQQTSERVSSDGGSTRITFNMKYPTRRACSIPLGEDVVLTGGMDTLKTVSRYNEGGWVRDIFSLNTGRRNHGCTSYSTGEEQEITSDLPRPMAGVSVSTLDNRVLLFGGYYGADVDRNNDILDYEADIAWVKVGKLTNRRSVTGVSYVNFNYFTNYCNN